jgi:phosphatidate phosphatase APP1
MTHPLVLHIEKGWGDFFAFLRRHLGKQHPVFLYPYRGYGHSSKVMLEGRVLEKMDSIHDSYEERDGKWVNFKKAWRRYYSHEVPGVRLKGTFHGVDVETVSDREGYFTLIFEGDFSDLEPGWKDVALEILQVPHDLGAQKTSLGEILLIDETSEFGIISDMDDTVMQSNVVTKLKMLSTMLFNSAESRVAFDGVVDLYQGLNDGERNPLFFISGSSYNLYDLLVKFCRVNDLPKAPMLLRDMGISEDYWFLKRTIPFKKEEIERLLTFFPDLPFILMGDSGQHDPEIYLDIQERYPDRILGIYIRHVPFLDLRNEELEELEQIHPNFIAIHDSEKAIEHARSRGWLS